MIIVIINVSNGHTNSGTTGSIGINGIPIPIFKTKPKNITTFKLNGKKVGKLEVELKDNSNLIEVIKNIKNAKGFNDNMININAEYEDEQSNQTYKIETVNFVVFKIFFAVKLFLLTATIILFGVEVT